MTDNLIKLDKELEKHKNPERAKQEQRFFKTGKGEYGEGDVFLGISVPLTRKISKEFNELNFNELKKLLNSKIHTKRLIVLLVLVEQYNKACKDKNENKKKEIFDFYLANTNGINNWDLVDLSAHKIVGNYLLNKHRDILYQLAVSNNLWERRISIISTFAFIRNNELDDSLKLSKILLRNKHDLMHKAVGWVLREIGKKDISRLKEFLKENYNQLPRTTLRYAIEKFPENERKKWLRGEIK